MFGKWHTWEVRVFVQSSRLDRRRQCIDRLAEKGGIDIDEIIRRVVEEIAVGAGGQIGTRNVKQVRVIV
jgi:hypothetical protein